MVNAHRHDVASHLVPRLILKQATCSKNLIMTLLLFCCSNLKIEEGIVSLISDDAYNLDNFYQFHMPISLFPLLPRTLLVIRVPAT